MTINSVKNPITVLIYPSHKLISLIYMTEITIVNWSAVEEGYWKCMCYQTGLNCTTHNAFFLIRLDFGHFCVLNAIATSCDLYADSWSISVWWRVGSRGGEVERRRTDRRQAICVPNDLTIQQQVQCTLSVCQRSLSSSYVDTTHLKRHRWFSFWSTS